MAAMTAILTATPMNYHERRRTVRTHKASYFQALWTMANYDEQTERSSTLPNRQLAQSSTAPDIWMCSLADAEWQGILPGHMNPGNLLAPDCGPGGHTVLKPLGVRAWTSCVDGRDGQERFSGDRQLPMPEQRAVCSAQSPDVVA